MSYTRPFTVLGRDGSSCVHTRTQKGVESTAEARRDGAKDRYDGRRPVLSVRVSDAQKKNVEEMARITGKSVGRLVREGLSLEVKDLRKVYKEGYEKGRREAMKDCLVTVPCICGRGFPVVGKERVSKVEKILAINCNWYHRSCRPKNMPKAECKLFKDRRPGKGRRK